MRTTFPFENGEPDAAPKLSPNISGHLGSENECNVKFPKRLRHNGKGRVLATIYKRRKGYRLYWRTRVDGKPRSRFKDFPKYSEAKKAADKTVRDLAKNTGVPTLSPGQASDALAAFERLQSFYVSTGRRVSLLTAVCEYCDSASKFNGHNFPEAFDGFLKTVVCVKRKDLTQAVEDFIAGEEVRTKANDGRRPQLSSKYHYNRAIMLRRFAHAFPGHAVSDLAKTHLDTFIGGLSNLKSKSRNRKRVASSKCRNHHRAAIKQFLEWAVRKDYLAVNNRLGEADSMRPEHANDAEVRFYTPAEFQALLDVSEGSMHATIAIGGLAGLRTSELLRLSWQDVWRTENHIEVTAAKAKTRQRRLVEICPALARWLQPYRQFEQGKVCDLHEVTWQQKFVDLCAEARVEIKGKPVPVTRKPNGLRHAFCTYHFAFHGNENLTAQQAGNSPSMIHGHYKGLATKKEAEGWFSIMPILPSNVTLPDAGFG
jgi:integrase